MNSLRLRIGTAVLSVLAAALLAAASPEVSRGLSNCTASQLVPAFGDVTVNQGLGNYAYRVRGKDTLVKFFLTNPTTCAVTNTQSINITGATLTVNDTVQTSPPIGAFQSFGGAPAVTAAVSNTSAADPVFAVPSQDLEPAFANPDTQTFTPTFTATVTYSRKSGTTTTSGLTATFSNQSATFDHRTRALRVLVVPMGDARQGVLANTQYTAADQTATQNGFSALSRIFPVPSGVANLGGLTGGIRYTIDLSAMVNLKAITITPSAYDVNGKFCGSGANFDAIKAQLSQFMQSWNSNPLNANQQADRVLGVVGGSISDGADVLNVSCADGMASVISPEAWVRAIADKPAAGRVAAVPSRTGSLMAMELSHTWGGEPTSTHHSTNVTADTTNPGRAYNVTTRSYLATNRSVMKYSFVTSPPWDDTLTLLEPADYSYDRCAFGGTTTTDCSALGTTTGTTLGVAAGPSFVVSGTVNTATNTADIVQSGFLSSQLIGEDDNSYYRYVRRDATTHQILANIGFHVSFENSLHTPGAADDQSTAKGLFSFALPDALPTTSTAEVQLWKASSNSPSYDPSEPTDVLLYDKRQRPTAPQDLGFATLGAGQPGKYTDTQFVNEEHPALSDDGNWVAWEAPLAPSVPGSTVIHVAPAGSSANDITLPVPTAGKHIVFESNRDGGDLEIYSMNADGSGETRLTNSPGRDIMPAASPDGTQIAFVSDRTESDQVYVMDANGGNVQQLTTQGSNAFPAWSPDGSKIAFMSDRSGGQRQIWVMDANGGNQHAVTTGGDDYYPTWSPDGQKIAFASGRGGGTSQIWVANSDGSGSPTRLTIGPAVHDQPSWSTDGSKIAFSGGSNGAGPFDVWVMNADGSGQTDLTADNAGDDRIASWSPDASKIAFTSTRGGNEDVYVMNPNGSGVTRVTTNAADDASASWSPARVTGLQNAFPAWKHDGSALAYAFEGDLYTQGMNTTGASATVVGYPTPIYTAGDGEFGPPAAHHPSWSLDGSLIAFEAGADIYTIPSGGGTPTQLTHDTDAHDPSWSHTAVNPDLIAYTRGPENCGTSSAKLYVVTPSGTRTSAGNVSCSLFPSFGTNGRIAFTSEDGNIWSIKPDGGDSKQLTIGGQDSFPSTAGDRLAFDRLFSSGSCPITVDECFVPTELDIMLTSLTASGNTAFSAASDVPLKAEVDHEVNGTAYPVYVGLEPTEVDGAIQTWYINFDGSNAPSGGALRTRFTDGVQYTTGGSVVAPTVAPKPPTAAIFSPPDTTYSYRATLPLSGTGYDAEGKILPPENLHWTLTLPNGTSYPLPNGGNFTSTDLQPPAAGWPAGTLTFTLVASDGTLSSAPVTRNVRVVAYDFVGAGFLPPILNPPGVNTGKPGAQFPMKWQLKSPSGKFISDLGTVKAVEYQTDGSPPTCNFSSSMGPRVALPNGGTALRYDTKNNQFVYNWTTPTSPGCYVFTLTLTDGSEHQAWFQLS